MDRYIVAFCGVYEPKITRMKEIVGMLTTSYPMICYNFEQPKPPDLQPFKLVRKRMSENYILEINDAFDDDVYKSQDEFQLETSLVCQQNGLQDDLFRVQNYIEEEEDELDDINYQQIDLEDKNGLIFLQNQYDGIVENGDEDNLNSIGDEEDEYYDDEEEGESEEEEDDVDEGDEDEDYDEEYDDVDYDDYNNYDDYDDFDPNILLNADLDDQNYLNYLRRLEEEFDEDYEYDIDEDGYEVDEDEDEDEETDYFVIRNEYDIKQEFIDDDTDSYVINNNIESPQGSILISCEHIVEWKDKPESIYIYSKLYQMLIMSINSGHRKFKSTTHFCLNQSCDGIPSRLHVCLTCQYFGCYTRKHIHEHFLETGHQIAMDSNHGYLYCFGCGDYIFDEGLENLSLELKREAMMKNHSSCKYNWEPNRKEGIQLVKFATKKFDPHPGYKGLRGLINLGSTCFMNCIIQTLVHTQPLRDYFLGDLHVCPRPPSTCLVCEMSHLVQEFHSDKHTPHIPDKLLHLVWTHAKHLAGYEQQDAQEFFINFLDILHKHSQDENDANTSNYQKCSCIIDKIFTGSLQSDLVCQSCGGVSSVEDPIWDFSLDLINTTGLKSSNIINHNNGDKNMTENLNSNIAPKTVTLYECLRLFTRTEHLGSAAKIKCNQCQGYEEFTKKLSFKKLPIVASFHLKRFKQTNKKNNKKISTFVEFPTSIDLTPFTTSQIGSQTDRAEFILNNHGDYDSINGNNLVNGGGTFNFKRLKKMDNSYSLFAVVNHSGTLETGHYTVFVKCDGHWFKCDDHFVTRSTEAEVLKSEGYLLFYQKNHYEFDQ